MTSTLFRDYRTVQVEQIISRIGRLTVGPEVPTHFVVCFCSGRPISSLYIFYLQHQDIWNIWFNCTGTTSKTTNKLCLVEPNTNECRIVGRGPYRYFSTVPVFWIQEVSQRPVRHVGEKLSCNGVEMIREYISTAHTGQEDQYVYDVYYTEGIEDTTADFDDSMLDSLGTSSRD